MQRGSSGRTRCSHALSRSAPIPGSSSQRFFVRPARGPDQFHELAVHAVHERTVLFDRQVREINLVHRLEDQVVGAFAETRGDLTPGCAELRHGPLVVLRRLFQPGFFVVQVDDHVHLFRQSPVHDLRHARHPRRIDRVFRRVPHVRAPGHRDADRVEPLLLDVFDQLARGMRIPPGGFRFQSAALTSVRQGIERIAEVPAVPHAGHERDAFRHIIFRGNTRQKPYGQAKDKQEKDAAFCGWEGHGDRLSGDVV